MNGTENNLKLKDLEAELIQFIQAKNPTYPLDTELTLQQILNYRYAFINQLLNDEIKATETFNENYHKEIENKKFQTKNLNKSFDKQVTFGDKVSDKIAKFGGSWPFIISFIVFLALWIILNATGLLFKPFDNYPFILLNLALSCLAALQAPIIMMSQNRQSVRDRIEADNDYEINIKAEIEIDSLHQKMDYLMTTKWQHIIQLQQLQIEMLTLLQKSEEKQANLK
ncbi:DUF1003 domain-containing protein [Enterococcus sp. MMGLQ5-2]|nr:DUF1003 domain-containing protein [Enterococcus sp. MMGLQ5-2]MBS7583717.1 DUF1003 domain-containing protein [Enterococcus sp. MMGLQ5-1]NPD11578.1 DUF1003 domain-containing protein [Enterococcus sp. MMGLQ5-1]NPD36322.1 DUF1003 domain-containing protein [Enterococcus sp. MMGLQ5-2]